MITQKKMNKHILHGSLRTNKHTELDANVTELDGSNPVSTTWIIKRDASVVTDYCKSFGLRVECMDKTHLKVSGKAKQIQKAMNVTLQKHTLPTGKTYHTPKNNPSLPESFQSMVEHVIGLDTYPIAKPRFVLPKLVTSSSTKKFFSTQEITPTFTPLNLATLYSFPSGNGLNQKIGIIELGGGYLQSDLVAYFASLGITGSPNVTTVSIDGGTNDPTDPSGASYEVILDVEVIIALCPAAATRVYFAPNTSQGFYNAIHRAITDGCHVISISWGAPENYWASSDLTSYNSLFQSTINANAIVFAASGDDGSNDGESGNHADFPASSPYVVGCGGTSLVANGIKTVIQSEVVWNNGTGATGGGISAIFGKPSYQNSVSYNLNGKRGVPDVAGNADPNTGYLLLYNNSYIVIGGTSAVSPLWSGLLGRIYQNISPLTISSLQTVLYANPNVFRAITSGNNGAFQAGVGWDACTGLGTPNGVAIQAALNGTSPPPPTPTPSIAAPVPNFTVSKTIGRISLTVFFFDHSTKAPTSWLWRFGDGATSTQQNPMHKYGRGTFTVSLTVTNAGGSNIITRVRYITVF